MTSKESAQNSTSDSFSHPSRPEENLTEVLHKILGAIVEMKSEFSHNFGKLDSKFEATALGEFDRIRSPEFHAESNESGFRSHRQSLGSYHSSSSQGSQVGKSSFRLEKPKYEYPKDPKVDGATDESVLKFIDECESHIVIWKTLPENKDKIFEGSENFALVSLPTSVQRSLAHSMDFAYSRGDLVTMTEEEVANVKWWSTAKTAFVKKTVLDRQAQHQSILAAIKSIQPPEISYPKDTGFIHLQSFEDYKTRFLTQVSRLAEGGVVIPVVSIKDAIISAIPDHLFRAELYAVFGHAGSLPGPDMNGRTAEISIRGIFHYIHKHIIVIKQKGLAGVVNRQSVTFTPPTARKLMGNSSFSKVHSIDHIRPETQFPETDQAFWDSRQSHSQHSAVQASDDDEYTSVNAVVRDASSKECRHVGIGPDGKLLCPWLGNPDTAKCGFRHSPKELELKGKGVSRSVPAQQKKVHHVSEGLGVPYADDAAENSFDDSNL